MNKPKLGYALCGSFCTLAQSVQVLEELAAEGCYDLYPIMSGITYETDTRFGKAEEFRRRVESACGREILHTIPQVEPIGPKGYLDVLVVAPCTGNTLSKLASGITDSSVTMAVKAHLRNQKPVVLALATNDALSGSAKGLGTLLGAKGIYFVPMAQDDPEKKPASLIADFHRIPEAVQAALEGRQLEPIFYLL